MSIAEAVDRLRDRCKETTLFSVARGSGVSYPVVYRFAKDPSYKIRIDTLQRIESFFTEEEHQEEPPLVDPMTGLQLSS
jgi:hypothetical protein